MSDATFTQSLRCIMHVKPYITQDRLKFPGLLLATDWAKPTLNETLQTTTKRVIPSSCRLAGPRSANRTVTLTIRLNQNKGLGRLGFSGGKLETRT